MKKIITLAFFGLLTTFHAFSDVGQNYPSGDTGTAQVDEHYLDALSKKDSAPDRMPVTDKEKSAYDHLSSKEKVQERQEEGRSETRPLK
jgi:hypothetical protein